MDWGWMKAGCLCAVWSSAAGLTSLSLDESCAGGDDEGEWGEKCCFWCDEWDVDDVESDVLLAPLLNGIDRKIRGSSSNITLIFGFGLGSWKEYTLSLLLGFFSFALEWSWNDELSWHTGFKWAQFLLYCFPFGPSMMYEHPQSNISLTVPVNHFNFMSYCLFGKKCTCSLTLRTHSSLALWAWSKCSFWVFCISSSWRHILCMLMGLWGRGMTAPCAGHPCKISAGDGKSDASGVSHSCSSAQAWASGDPSVFL